MNRLWDKVERTDSCWLWQGATNGRYGQLSVKGKMVGAHRLAYELTYGAIGPGLWVLHKCDTPLCVRPDHLFAGNRSENMADAYAKGRLPHFEATQFGR